MAHAEILSELRALVACADWSGRATRDVLPFDLLEIDSHLRGGLPLGALHEVTGGPELAQQGAAALFIAGVAARLTGRILWCLRARDLFAPALLGAGLSPHRVIFAEAGDEASVLAVMEEGLRHSGLAAVVGELKKLPMIASRRLQLAAEGSGVTALALMRWQKGNVEPSAAWSRWQVRPLPSGPLPVRSLGRARWRVELLRCRGIDPAFWDIEACDETGHLGLPADLADGSAAPARQGMAA